MAISRNVNDYYNKGYQDGLKAVGSMGSAAPTKADDLSYDELISEFDKRGLNFNTGFGDDPSHNKYAMAVIEDFDRLDKQQQDTASMLINLKMNDTIYVWVNDDAKAEIRKGLSGFEIRYDPRMPFDDLDLLYQNDIGIIDWVNENQVEGASGKWK